MRVALAFNIAIVVLVAWALFLTMTAAPGELLQTTGVENLRYFTVLSNLLLGVASVFYAVQLSRCLRRGAAMLGWLHVLKYVATVSVGLTFAVVVGFFAPLYGLLPLARGANFWFHLVLPVAGIIEFCVFDTGIRLPFSRTLIAVIPALVYGIAYYLNIVLNGVGEWPDTNDWYGFAQAGMQWAPAVFAAVLVASWVIALAIWLVNARVGRRSRT